MYLPLFFLCEIYKKLTELTDVFVQVNYLGFGVKIMGSPGPGLEDGRSHGLPNSITLPLPYCSCEESSRAGEGRKSPLRGLTQAQQGLLSGIQFCEVSVTILFLLKVIDQTSLRISHT